MALVTIVLEDFVFHQLTRYEPVLDALETLEGTVDVYPASAVEMQIDE